jgi:tetratricopeptide (TPR) repeat protein
MRRGQPPRRARLAPDDREGRRREGQVAGPFTRRKPAARQEEAPASSSSYRLKSNGEPARPKPVRSKRGAAARKEPVTATTNRRRRHKATEATEELRKLAGRQSDRALDALAHASDAFTRGHERDALRILRPLVDTYPRAAAVRELAGLCRYRLGMYPAAADDLQAFVDLTGSTEQHPVLMDCRRAQRRLQDVASLWEDLRESSPSAALVTEGRIVYAGALADAGHMADAIALLERRTSTSQRPQEHTVRLWYALADLYDRSGDIPRARAFFEQVRLHDRGFADVAERLAALS